MPGSSRSAPVPAPDHRVAPGAAGTLSGVATRTWPEPVQRVTAYLREAGAEVRVEEFAEGTPTADAAKIAQAAGSPFARIAGTEEVNDATGFEPGAVAPFPLPRVATVFIERTLLAQPVLWIGAGSSNHMASLTPTELLRLSRARPMDAVDEAT